MNFGDAKFDGAIDKKFQGQYNYLVDLLSRQLKKEFDFYKSELQKYSKVPETGSNANGNYVKYEDGTLICWRLPFTLNATGIAQNFPVPFVSTPAFTIMPHNSTASALRVAGVTALSATSVTFYPYNSFTTRIDATTCSWIAIGKWK